jgi:crotonobetainyl-CoA:carnitine CoA-transferase CaiB-like acyl-CoA transferase
MSESNSYLLSRSGRPPLKFTGEEIAGSEGRIQNGHDHNRWHDLTVYRTAAGAYVVAIQYHTQWQGECEHAEAVVCGDTDEVAAQLQSYDPAQYCQGYPAGEPYKERQARLLSDLRARYEAQISEVLSGEEFAEKLD